MSTIDLETKTDSVIPIKERHASEITEGFGKSMAPGGVKVFHPAFDVTPHELISAIITEKGILTENYQQELPKLFQ